MLFINICILTRVSWLHSLRRKAHFNAILHHSSPVTSVILISASWPNDAIITCNSQGVEVYENPT